jgi:dTDP-4-amino-4,6-dideoxygalactose transaminase
VKASYRPAGNKILLDSGKIDEALLGSAEPMFYQSGTAALSSSITACIQLKGILPNQAEIIVPAYACPDLISAIVFAGAIPVPVDISRDSPGYLIKELNTRLSDQTVAIIAINFLGIADQLSKIKIICKAHEVFLINDSAQWFPASRVYKWTGDFNIISFGRGKPVSLLQGGAVIAGNPANTGALPTAETEESSLLNTLAKSIKIRLYNLVIKPKVYALIRKLPGLNIGETIYEPLDRIDGMGDFEIKLIGPNIRKYQSTESVIPYLHCQLSQVTHALLINLVANAQDEMPTKLLRYPILIKDRHIRDQFCARTRDLGVSILYPKPLNQLEGLNSILNSETVYPNASDFSDHLVTLPCHEDITEAVVDQIIVELKQVLGITE